MEQKLRNLSLLLVVVILLTASIGAIAQGYSGAIETEAQGNNGPVAVTTTITDGQITGVEVTNHAETPGISDPAIERIPAAIAQNNSVNVDTVTGATNTSNAIISAVKAALAQAGLNEADFMGGVQQASAEDQEYTTDVLVIGAGGAGLSAANAAIREGKSVLVLEKMPTVGGATAVSGGGFMGGASKLQAERGVTGDTPQAIYDDLLAGGEDNYEPLLRLYAENAGDTVDWMYYDLKLPFREGAPSQSVEHSYARGFAMEGGAAGITKSLYDVFVLAGGEVIFDTRATELIMAEGKVSGAIANGVNGETVTVHAEDVILATGGYGNNKELLPPSVSDILYYGPVCSTGDGLIMAEAVGATTHYMDHVKVYPQGIETAPGFAKVATGASMTVTRVAGAIYVNSKGERMLNENEPFVNIKNKTIEQPEREIFIFMDQATFEQWRQAITTFMPLEEVDKYVAQNGGVPMFADAATVEEVAAIAGVDAAGLKATMDRFNGFVKEGVDEDYGRTELFEIGEGPYYLIEQKLRFASTLGGLKTNESMQVLDGNDTPIPGLYAAGETVGGAHGKESMPTCNVGWALTSGRLAGLAVSGK